MSNVKHSCDSPEWGTPGYIINLSQEFLKVIDLDPASCTQANQLVKAKRYFTKEDDGLSKDWKGRVFLNSPGKLKKKFWNKLVAEYLRGNVKEAIYLCYSQEELQTSQNKTTLSCSDFPLVIPKNRLKYTNLITGVTPKSPPCSSAIILLPDSSKPSRLKDFYNIFNPIGKVLIPYEFSRKT